LRPGVVGVAFAAAPMIDSEPMYSPISKLSSSPRSILRPELLARLTLLRR